MKQEVTNNVNLNINQSDLVDILVEDLKEGLEKEIATLKPIVKGHEKKLDDLRDLLKDHLKTLITDPLYNEIKKFCKKNGRKFFEFIEVDDNKTEVVSEIIVYRIDSIRSYKAALQQIDKQRDSKRFVVYVPKRFKALVKENNDNGHYMQIGVNYMSEKIEVTPDKFITDNIAEQVSVTKLLVKSLQDLQAKELDLIRAEFGEKRFKAQFIKASLETSQEGKQVLAMIEQVKKGTKLLK